MSSHTYMEYVACFNCNTTIRCILHASLSSIATQGSLNWINWQLDCILWVSAGTRSWQLRLSDLHWTRFNNLQAFHFEFYNSYLSTTVSNNVMYDLLKCWNWPLIETGFLLKYVLYFEMCIFLLHHGQDLKLCFW